MIKEESILQVLRIFYPGHKTWLVKTLVVAGVGIIARPFWEPIIVSMLNGYAKVDIPNGDWAGWILLSIGIAVFVLNERYAHLEQQNDSNRCASAPLSELHGLSMSCSWGITEEDLIGNEGCLIWDLNGGSLAPATMHAVSGWRDYYKTKLSRINKHIITNHSDVPLFDLKIPVRIECWKVENADNPDGNRQPPERRVEINLPVTDKKLQPGGELVFFSNNVSALHIEVTFSQSAIATTLHSKEEIFIPLKMESLVCGHSLFLGGHQTLNSWLCEKRDSHDANT